MPDSANEKTEQPTPERMRRARSEGQLPQSQEIPTAMMVTALLLTMCLSASGLFDWMSTTVRDGLGVYRGPGMDSQSIRGLLYERVTSAMWAASPFFVCGAGVSIAASLISSGLVFCPKNVKFKLSNISPVKGLKKLFSLQALVRLLMSIAKLVAIGLIVWLYVRNKLNALVVLRYATPTLLLIEASRLVFGAVARICIALMVIGIADLIYQRWNWKKGLRMTRQEIKEETRQYESAPEVKSRIRTLQMQMARKRMLSDVPKADVVVTNPTHFAVALEYDRDNMAAPVVLAKGADLVAQRIREIAKDNKIPIIERPPLARALYKGVEIGQPIPENLFVAVAEVLAIVYRLNKSKARPA